MVQDYETLPLAQGAWEAHRRHIDLQYLVAGTERIGYANVGRLVPGVYNRARDLLPLAGAGSCLALGPGGFMLLYPEDAHMPRVELGVPTKVRKVVVKIAVEP